MDDAKHMRKMLELRSLPSWNDMKYLAVLYGLEGCEVFHLLDDETKDREWNGIGSDAFPKFIRRFLDFLFEDALPAACIHDFRFVIGGPKDDFYKANGELKRNLFKCLRANKKHYSFIGYHLTKLKIRLAVWLCNEFGYEGWRNKTNETN